MVFIAFISLAILIASSPYLIASFKYLFFSALEVTKESAISLLNSDKLAKTVAVPFLSPNSL